MFFDGVREQCGEDIGLTLAENLASIDAKLEDSCSPCDREKGLVWDEESEIQIIESSDDSEENNSDQYSKLQDYQDDKDQNDY